MASASGKGNDGGVTMEQLKEVEYELQRNKMVEENEKRLAVLRQKSAAMQDHIEKEKQLAEANKPPKKKKLKRTSDALPSTNRVLRPRVVAQKDGDHVDPGQQPSNEITPELNNAGKKGGRSITQKADVYARLNQPKIQIPLNEYGQPVGPKATEFANFIGTLVRKHIPPGQLDWRDVEGEKKMLVWKTLKAFYEVDTTALRFVINTSHTKWKEWKADLKKSRFDPKLTDEELMKRRDERISITDWQTLISHWRSPLFESRSAISKKNRANAVPHTSGSKSHAIVADEMAEELGHKPGRDEVYIKTHTHKEGGYVPKAAETIKKLIETAENHPELKEKSIEEGDLFAHVCGMKEPRGCVRVLGQSITPQDLRTPGTRGKVSTRVLVEMEGRRQAENRMNMMEVQMQQMQEEMKQMKEMLKGRHEGHNLEAPSSHHGSNSRNDTNNEHNSDEDDDLEEEDGDDVYIQRRVLATAPLTAPARSSSTHQDESLLGMDVLLYAWTGPETPVAKATIISTDPHTIVGRDPLGPENYEVIVNVSLKKDAVLPYQDDGLRYMSDAVKMSIAWPSTKMKPYRPGTSSSNRC